MRIRYPAAALVLLLLFTASASAAETRTVNLGGSPVTYQVPEGFIEITSTSHPQAWRMVRDTLSDEIFLLGTFVAPESLRNGEIDTSNRFTHCAVFLIPSVGSIDFTPSLFNRFKELTRQGVSERSRVVQADLREGRATARPVRLIGDGPRHVSVITMPTEMPQDGRAPYGITASNVLIGPRVVTVSFRRPVADQTDVEVLEELTRSYVAQVQ